MKRVIMALTLVLSVLTIQACDDNGNKSESITLNCGDILTTSSRTLKATDNALNCDGTVIMLDRT